MAGKYRPPFVFAGQSNMMGAAVYPPAEQIYYRDSFEYLHKPKRMGEACGTFKKTAYPAGEFSYRHLKKAYGGVCDPTRTSTLADYRENTFFCPAMCNLADEQLKTRSDFRIYSEADFQPGPTLAAYWTKELEERGICSAYTHIAKGSVGIGYFMDDQMLSEFREKRALQGIRGDDFIKDADAEGAAGTYFQEKVSDFFADSENCFRDDDLSQKVLVWLQGEDDYFRECEDYQLALDILWNKAKQLAFTHFFCVRVAAWGNPHILQVIKAQEDFCRRTRNAYIITRACSLMPFPDRDMSDWFIQPPDEEYRMCRDSFYGFENHHVNQKGFELLAQRAVENAVRVLLEGKEPVLEKENIIGL